MEEMPGDDQHAPSPGSLRSPPSPATAGLRALGEG
jgi:hypothetical protein